MQLNKHRRISGALTAAGCTLLGLPVSAQAQTPTWDVTGSLFIYSEDDNRVTDLSAKSLLKKELDEDRNLTVNVQVDTLSGASPNGAVPTSDAQTFSRPSGNGSYRTDANETPLDNTFQDTRGSVSASYTRQHNRLTSSTLGASVSAEFDYLHLGLNAALARDFNQRNTTLNAGLALSFDNYSPVGGTPDPLTLLSINQGDDEDEVDGDEQENDDDQHGTGLSTTKQIADLLLGVTQVLSRRAIAQANYSLSLSDGYLNDPYKFLSVVDGNSGELVLQDDGYGSYLFEQRPDQRISHNLFFRLKYKTAPGIADVSYRYHTDDWDVISHTFDMKFRVPLSDKNFIEPHLRYYTQTAASFHRYFLTEGETPKYASADYRLAAFDATTAGLRFGRTLDEDSEFSVRLERYQASGDDSPDEAVGALKEQDLYPEVGAWILQASYQKRF